SCAAKTLKPPTPYTQKAPALCKQSFQALLPKHAHSGTVSTGPAQHPSQRNQHAPTVQLLNLEAVNAPLRHHTRKSPGRQARILQH
ncbi:MAG TPA: hypothetical protein VIH34_02840, partial [Candidatus Bathyarchaeia archaeon]